MQVLFVLGKQNVWGRLLGQMASKERTELHPPFWNKSCRKQTSCKAQAWVGEHLNKTDWDGENWIYLAHDKD